MDLLPGYTTLVLEPPCWEHLRTVHAALIAGTRRHYSGVLYGRRGAHRSLGKVAIINEEEPTLRAEFLTRIRTEVLARLGSVQGTTGVITDEYLTTTTATLEPATLVLILAGTQPDLLCMSRLLDVVLKHPVHVPERRMGREEE